MSQPPQDSSSSDSPSNPTTEEKDDLRLIDIEESYNQGPDVLPQITMSNHEEVYVLETVRQIEDIEATEDQMLKQALEQSMENAVPI